MTLQSADFGKIAITWGGAWTARAIEKLTCVAHANATWISTRDMLASEEPGICAAWSKATEGVTNTSGSCETPAATAAKTMNAVGFTLSTGASVSVTFAHANTAASPTLNVGGTGAAPADLSGIVEGRPYRFQYNGTEWVRESPVATTSAPGIVRLETSTTSTSTDKAATPSAVKAAKDAADAAQTTANAKTTMAEVNAALPNASVNYATRSGSTAWADDGSWANYARAVPNVSVQRVTNGFSMPSGGTWRCFSVVDSSGTAIANTIADAAGGTWVGWSFGGVGYTAVCIKISN